MDDNQDILALLPHQPPFRFIDKVSRYNPGCSLEAHFNTNSLDQSFGIISRKVPESILIEGVAQTAVLLAQLETSPLLPGEIPLLGSVKVSLFSNVDWGQTLCYLVKPVRILEKQAILSGEVYVKDKTIMSMLLSVAVAQNKDDN